MSQRYRLYSFSICKRYPQIFEHNIPLTSWGMCNELGKQRPFRTLIIQNCMKITISSTATWLFLCFQYMPMSFRNPGPTNKPDKWRQLTLSLKYLSDLTCHDIYSDHTGKKRLERWWLILHSSLNCKKRMILILRALTIEQRSTFLPKDSSKWKFRYLKPSDGAEQAISGADTPFAYPRWKRSSSLTVSCAQCRICRSWL